MPVRNTGKAALICAAFFLAACADIPRFGGSREAVEQWAGERGFSHLILSRPPFRLLALARLRQSRNDGPLTIFIEGDGAAWPTPYRPPSDPTPTRPVALALAAEDRSEAVIYLGRPCQYLTPEQLAACSPAWWTDKRFSGEVLNAYQHALDEIKAQTGRKHLRLVGYSGGGVIAALLADHRQDVDHVTTIASPLALGSWLAWHKASPLPRAIDPVTLKSPARIPAEHIVGDEDDIVPAKIVNDYVKIRGGSLTRVKGADHDCCWLGFWKLRQRKEEDQNGRN